MSALRYRLLDRALERRAIPDTVLRAGAPAPASAARRAAGSRPRRSGCARWLVSHYLLEPRAASVAAG